MQVQSIASVSSSISLHENDIAREVVDAAYHVHRGLGPGLLETVYEVILAHELRKRGLNVERQVPVTIIRDNIRFEEGYRADLIVGGKLVVELKSKEQVIPVDKKQVLTQLRLSGLRLGLLINFGEELIKNGISRIVNGLED